MHLGVHVRLQQVSQTCSHSTNRTDDVNALKCVCEPSCSNSNAFSLPHGTSPPHCLHPPLGAASPAAAPQSMSPLLCHNLSNPASLNPPVAAQGAPCTPSVQHPLPRQQHASLPCGPATPSNSTPRHCCHCCRHCCHCCRHCCRHCCHCCRLCLVG